MKKTVYTTVLILALMCMLYMLFFQGFGFPSISPVLDAILRILSGLSLQLLVFFVTRRTGLRLLPLILSVLAALWGGWLFAFSESWSTVTFDLYVADYCTAAIGCAAVWIVNLLRHRKNT